MLANPEARAFSSSGSGADFTIFPARLQRVTCLLSQWDMSVPALAALESEPVSGTHIPQPPPTCKALQALSPLRGQAAAPICQKESLNLDTERVVKNRQE